MKMNEKPLISVIVTVYNVAPFLNRCVDSILNQTYGTLEILLIDDGSSDNSEKICDAYQASDRRVKAVHKPNEGTVSARENGLQCAHGQLVSFVDGDDWIDKNMYEYMVDFYLGQGEPDIVSSGLVYEYIENDRRRVLLDEAGEGRYDRDEIERKLLPTLVYNPLTGNKHILTSVCTKLINKRVAQQAMKYMRQSLTLGEDGAYVYFLAGCCSSFAVMHESFYHYEQHENSQNNRLNIAAYQKLAELREVMIQGMESLGWKDSMQIKEQINYYVWDYLWRVIEGQFHLGISRFMYLFPFAKCEKDRTVLVYGAGIVGRSYVQCLEKCKYSKSIIWADQDYKRLQIHGLNVVSPKEALLEDYDYIVIAIEDERIAKEVMEGLSVLNIEKKKVIWEKPVRINPYV